MKWERAAQSIGFALSAFVIAAALIFSAMANHDVGFTDEPAVRAGSEINVFDEFRAERMRVRELETAQLTAMLKDPEVDEEARYEAARLLNEMTECMEVETTIEGILKMRGHDDAVATVHPGSVNIVIREGASDKAECAFILDLVLRETGQTAGNVKIIAVS